MISHEKTIMEETISSYSTLSGIWPKKYVVAFYFLSFFSVVLNWD